jgi:hypothetical protein
LNSPSPNVVSTHSNEYLPHFQWRAKVSGRQGSLVAPDLHFILSHSCLLFDSATAFLQFYDNLLLSEFLFRKKRGRREVQFRKLAKET